MKAATPLPFELANDAQGNLAAAPSHSLPRLENCWLSLLKDTSLVSVVGLAETLRNAYTAARVTRHAFLFYSVASLVFLLLAVLSSFASSAILHSLGRREAQQ